MTVFCSTSHLIPDGIVGSTEQIRDILCGPQDHNEHVKGWRWEMYVQDDKKRMESVMVEIRKMHAERQESMTAQQQADLALAEWQSHRGVRARA